MSFGFIIDLETTGLNPEQDRIIELGMLEFTLEDPVKITNMYSGLQDPMMPISEEVRELTGLDQLTLKGQKIDWTYVRERLEKAKIVIAHNADFDRPFLEKTEELFGLDLHWGCSLSHIDWKKHGFKSRNLNYLACDHGFVNPFPHRALFDCATTFKLIAPHIDELIERSYLRQFLFKATNSPFASKDALKQRGYRWSPEEKVWSRVVFEDTVEEEREFLSKEVYPGKTQHEERAI